jgi:hypothetical protein
MAIDAIKRDRGSGKAAATISFFVIESVIPTEGKNLLLASSLLLIPFYQKV